MMSRAPRSVVTSGPQMAGFARRKPVSLCATCVCGYVPSERASRSSHAAPAGPRGGRWCAHDGELALSQTIKPVFLYSLPRSGSTLVQRILGSHDAVSTVSEPWLLLPLIGTYVDLDVKASYDHAGAMTAIEDLCDTMPGGKDAYREAVREFALRVYAQASDDGATYFLDKTPRYSQVASEVIALFPEAKHIILWRNPLAIAASMVHTWESGGWAVQQYKVDLYDGLNGLIAAKRRYGDRVLCVRYEDLLLDPHKSFAEVFAYLELPFDPEVLSAFSDLKLSGRMGDPTGTRDYAAIDHAPLEKWRRQLVNPGRKRWAEQYLRWIGQEKLALMGYSLEALLDELRGNPTTTRYVLSDASRSAFWLARGLMHRVLGERGAASIKRAVRRG